MNEKDIKIAETALSKFSYGIPRNFGVDLIEACIRENNQHGKYSSLLSQNLNRYLHMIRLFLLENEYIIATPNLQGYDQITKKGNKLKELGGHENYLEWEKKQEIKKKREWFIQYVLIPVLAFLAIVVAIILYFISKSS